MRVRKHVQISTCLHKLPRFKPGCQSEITKQLFLRTLLTENGHNNYTLSVTEKDHDNLAMSLSSSCLAPRLSTWSKSHPGCSQTLHPSSLSLVPDVSRQRSYRDRLLLARLNPPICRNIVGEGEAARPRAKESPDEQQYHCCFCHQCPRALLAQQSLGQVFLQPPCGRASPPERGEKLVSQGCFHQTSSG